MADFKEEQTLILIEVTGKDITQVKEEIIKASLKRKDYGDTVMMVNSNLNEIYITTTSEDFVTYLLSNENYIIKFKTYKLDSVFRRRIKK